MRLLLAGDIHGNSAWLQSIVIPAALQLKVDAIVALGDFGYWPGGDDGFLELAASSPLPLYFIDGNHEDHYALQADVLAIRETTHHDAYAPVPLNGSLIYLPRGSRLLVEGCVVACLGGARSIDRALRTPGVDWFLEEAVNQEDLDHLASGGSCDVLLTHDAPLCVPLPLLRDQDLTETWRAERPACNEHRLRIDEACEAVRPSWLVHGHYHCRSDASVEFPWGSVQVVSLAEDGSSPAANLAVLRLEDGVASVHPVAGAA